MHVWVALKTLWCGEPAAHTLPTPLANEPPTPTCKPSLPRAVGVVAAPSACARGAAPPPHSYEAGLHVGRGGRITELVQQQELLQAAQRRNRLCSQPCMMPHVSAKLCSTTLRTQRQHSQTGSALGAAICCCSLHWPRRRRYPAAAQLCRTHLRCRAAPLAARPAGSAAC